MNFPATTALTSGDESRSPESAGRNPGGVSNGVFTRSSSPVGSTTKSYHLPSEDIYQGDVQFIVSVDGVRIGGA